MTREELLALPLRDQQADFASRLVFMMNEARQLGLYRTMHKLHDAVREVGWEMAAILAVQEKERGE